MALEHYEVVWQSQFTEIGCTVNLMIEPALVDTAMRGNGVKEAPARQEISRRVRNAAAVINPRLRSCVIAFDHLIITKRE